MSDAYKLLKAFIEAQGYEISINTKVNTFPTEAVPIGLTAAPISCSYDYAVKPKDINAIKAEGIRELAESFRTNEVYDEDGQEFILDPEEQYAYDFMVNYANRLEEGE